MESAGQMSEEITVLLVLLSLSQAPDPKTPVQVPSCQALSDAVTLWQELYCCPESTVK